MSGRERPRFREPPRDPNDQPADWTTWEQVAADHAGFAKALEDLVAAGCDEDRLLELLDELHGVSDSDGASRARIATMRQQLRHAVESLEMLGVSAERVLLGVDPADLKQAWQTLSEVAKELRGVERNTDARRSIDREVCRALLVRYVKDATGGWHDREVSELLNGALAPAPNWGADDNDRRGNRLPEPKAYRLPDDPWESITVEAHRRWRNRNRALVELPELERRWQETQVQTYYGPSTMPF